METLEEVTNECIRRGLDKDKILMIQADFELEADVKRTAEETIQKFNQIDVLVNNAGMYATNTVETVTLECFDKIFAVNVRAPLQLTQLLAPHLIKTKGTVVNVSSVVGKVSMTDNLAYSMSKTALDHMTRSIAEELAPHGVRVNAVNPGIITTPLFKRSFGVTDEAVAQFLEEMKKHHAMRRTGTVDEVSRTIAFLASNDSSFTTGETVGTEGGLHLLVTKVQI
eukprot:XP_011670220.1 PREDICTED: estradiol 17-beta-dehydrogenase 8 [Strongylocentrotus purpuratus]